MSSAAFQTVELAVDPAKAASVVVRVIEDNKHRVVTTNEDGSVITFLTRKTMLSWELDGVAEITPTPKGSQVKLGVSIVAGRPTAMMDKRKNQKSVDKLAELIKSGAS